MNSCVLFLSDAERYLLISRADSDWTTAFLNRSKKFKRSESVDESKVLEPVASL